MADLRPEGPPLQERIRERLGAGGYEPLSDRNLNSASLDNERVGVDIGAIHRGQRLVVGIVEEVLICQGLDLVVKFGRA